MRHVSRFEADLLRITHVIVGRAPAAQAMQLLLREQPRPACLSRDAVELIQDTLAKGVTDWLVRRGGWKSERFMRGERVSTGRVWQRQSPTELGLVFSKNSLEFLLWLAAEKVPLNDQPWEPDEPETRTLGDRLLLAMALDTLGDTECGKLWSQSPTFCGDGLCALLCPELLSTQRTPIAPNFAPWLTSTGAAVLETLQQRIAQRWLQVERDRMKLVLPEQMQHIARVQAQLLEHFHNTIRAAGRRDLGRWMLIVGRELLAGAPSAERWTRNLDVKALRLAERTAIYREAVSLVRGLAALETWQREAANVGYFDENYAMMQLWKADWETYRGDAWCAAACEVLRQVEPLGS